MRSIHFRSNTFAKMAATRHVAMLAANASLPDTVAVLVIVAVESLVVPLCVDVTGSAAELDDVTPVT